MIYYDGIPFLFDDEDEWENYYNLLFLLEVAVQVEHSGKWPRDAGAVRRLRSAWLKEVGQGLSKEETRCQLRGEELEAGAGHSLASSCVRIGQPLYKV